MLYQKHVICGSLDVLRDLMTVSRAKQEGPQDQHVQRTLQQLDSIGGFFRLDDSRYSTQKFTTLGRRTTESLVSNPGSKVLDLAGDGRHSRRAGGTRSGVSDDARQG